MTAIKLTHANQKTTMYLAKALIGGWYHSPGHMCTHVVLSGGAVFPAAESPEEVCRLMEADISQPKTGKKKEK